VDGLTGSDQALSHRPGDVRGARLGAEQTAARRGAKHQAGRNLARAHRERRRHAGQQRRMAEALPRLQHLDHLALVDEIDRAGEDHPQSVRRLAVLDEHDLARLLAVLGGARRQARQLRGIDAVKRGMTGEECVQVLHVRRLNCVRIAPCQRQSTCQGNARH
jgi:hypothetical protein